MTKKEIIKTFGSRGFCVSPRGLTKYLRKELSSPAARELALYLLTEGPAWKTNLKKKIYRGSLYTSETKILEEFPDMSRKVYQTTISKLKKMGLIVTKSTNRLSLITSTLYEYFQSGEHDEVPANIGRCDGNPKTVRWKPENGAMEKTMVAGAKGGFEACAGAMETRKRCDGNPKTVRCTNKKLNKQDIKKKRGNPLEPPAAGAASQKTITNEEEGMDIRTAISPARPNLKQVKIREGETKPKPRKDKGDEFFGWTPSLEKGILSSKFFIRKYRSTIRSIRPSAKFSRVDAPGVEEGMASKIIDQVVEDKSINKDEKKQLEAVLEEWFEWYAKNKIGSKGKRVREVSLKLSAVLESWQEYQKIMDRPEIILARRSRSNKPSGSSSIIKALEELFQSGMSDEAKLRSAILSHGIVVTANYMKCRTEVEDPIKSIHEMLEKNFKTSAGININRQFYSKTCLNTCPAIRKNMVILSDWEERFSDIWDRAFPLKTPASNDATEAACKKFFEDLSSGL